MPEIVVGQTWEKKSFPFPTVVEVIDYDGESVSVKWGRRKRHASVGAFIGQGFRLIVDERGVPVRRCENDLPDCGQVTGADVNGAPLCRRCYESMRHDRSSHADECTCYLRVGTVDQSDFCVRRALPWSEEWPTEPGRYWFYGYRSGFAFSAGDGPRLFAAKSRPTVATTTDLTIIAEGLLVSRATGARGLWLPLIEPELPNWSAK
jgi:hypothetical protein